MASAPILSRKVLSQEDGRNELPLHETAWMDLKITPSQRSQEFPQWRNGNESDEEP